jgi:hypothetical protein
MNAQFLTAGPCVLDDGGVAEVVDGFCDVEVDEHVEFFRGEVEIFDGCEVGLVDIFDVAEPIKV